MGAARVLLLLVGLAAIAAGAWFYWKGKTELDSAEDVMAKRWGVWKAAGVVDEAKLEPMKKDPMWKPYKPVTAVTVTPFHDEFGFYVHRTQVQTQRAAMVLGGVGLVTVLLSLACKPRVAPPA